MYMVLDYVTKQADSEGLSVFIISTYTAGKAPDGCSWFFSWMEEAASDFRVSKSHLEKINYCVLGVGNSIYKDYFCSVSISHSSRGPQTISARKDVGAFI